MKLKIMTFDALNYIKKNLTSCLEHYANGDNPEVWLKEAIGTQAFNEVPDLEFDDFSLFINEDSPATTDVPNIKLLYGKLSQLNDSFATDERLWAGLAHTVFYDYMLKRWPGKVDEKSILNHYFFAGSRPRCYMVNSLARLWWIGKKTIDFNQDNPMAILDYIAHDINGYGFTLFGSNWSNSERSLKLFFDAVFSYTDEIGKKVDRELFNDVMQYTNCLCGVYILDACDDAFIRGKIKDYLFSRSEERKQEQIYNQQNNVKTTGVEKLDNIIRALNAIGGHGHFKQILAAYEDITQEKCSHALKEYIKRNLNANCPDVAGFAPPNKPLFYRISLGDEKVWKIANEYLVKRNLQNRKALMEDQINNLTDREMIVFNTVSSINAQRFTAADILQYKSALASVYNGIDDIEKLILEGLRSLRSKGLLELVDAEKQTLKKSYSIRIN